MLTSSCLAPLLFLCGTPHMILFITLLLSFFLSFHYRIEITDVHKLFFYYYFHFLLLPVSHPWQLTSCFYCASSVVILEHLYAMFDPFDSFVHFSCDGRSACVALINLVWSVYVFLSHLFECDRIIFAFFNHDHYFKMKIPFSRCAC